jgi:hypothetical protein
MKKIIFEKEKVLVIIKMYNEEQLGSHTISLKTGIGKKIIQNLLKENGVILRKSGRINLGGVKVANKKYHEKNKEKVSKYYTSWASENKDHLKQYRKNYQKENKTRINKRKREYEKDRKHKDPVYKLIGNFRTAIYTVLKENNMNKFGHYFETLGYTPNDLVNHLESQFKDGITWKNYGAWHVDHRLPITSFTFKDMNDPEFKTCWSLENLQPMWGPENISKSNHIL